MEQDNYTLSSGNRFIFSDEFYDNLENNTINQDKEKIDNNTLPNIEIPEINNNVIKQEEPKVEEKDLEINLPTYGDKIDEQVIETPKYEIIEEPDGDIDDNNGEIKTNNTYDVETGINTSLENELIQNQQVSNTVNDDIPFFPYEEKKEKNVYRAVRTKNTNQNLNNQTQFNHINDTKENSKTFNKPNIYVPEAKKEEWKPTITREPVVIKEEINYYEQPKEVIITKSKLLEELKEKEKQTNKISILARYGEDFCSYDYITNPAIGRDSEIKDLGLILITPEKSAILVGKPGIGKTSIVEGLAYRIQRNQVPDVLKGYSIISMKTTSLLGTLPNGEARLQTLIDEIKELDKIILFIDEIHMLMGATNDAGLDFANMFKESLGRGSIKMIGATTNDEYERYVLRDKAFVRRFQKIDVEEPTKEQTVEILMGTLPKIEKKANAKLKYTHYIQVEIMNFLVNITSEYKRIYGIGSRYPDICITIVNQAFSEAIFDDRNEVNILDIRNAIAHSKNIYPDVIRKELLNFDSQFKKLIDEELQK